MCFFFCSSYSQYSWFSFYSLERLGGGFEVVSICGLLLLSPPVISYVRLFVLSASWSSDLNLHSVKPWSYVLRERLIKLIF